MPIVRINRKKEFADRLRAYEILADGQKIDEIRAGASVEFYVPPGRHRIILKIDWCTSNAVEFTAGHEDVIEFDCGNNTKVIWALFYVIFASSQYLWLRKK